MPMGEDHIGDVFWGQSKRVERVEEQPRCRREIWPRAHIK